MPTVNVQNTETLKLYKNQYLYNGSRYQYLMTGRTDNVSFETWLGNPDYSKPVYYKSISEPILINEAINNPCQKLFWQGLFAFSLLQCT